MTITKTQTKFICYVVNFAVCFTVLFSCFTFVVPSHALETMYSYTFDELQASNHLAYVFVISSGNSSAKPSSGTVLSSYYDSSWHLGDSFEVTYSCVSSSPSSSYSYYSSDGLVDLSDFTYFYRFYSGYFTISSVVKLFFEDGFNLASFTIDSLEAPYYIYNSSGFTPFVVSYDFGDGVYVRRSQYVLSSGVTLSYANNAFQSDLFSNFYFSFSSDDADTSLNATFDFDYSNEYSSVFVADTSSISLSSVDISVPSDTIYGVNFLGLTYSGGSYSSLQYILSDVAMDSYSAYVTPIEFDVESLITGSVTFVATSTNELEQLQELNQNVLKIYSYISEPDEDTQTRIDELTAQQESIDAQLKDISAALDVTADDDVLYNALDSGLSVIDNVSSTVGAGSALGTLIFDGSLSFLPWLLCFIIGFGFIMFILYGKRG